MARSRHCHRAIIFYISATTTCATFLISRQWRGGAKSGASAQHCIYYYYNCTTYTGTVYYTLHILTLSLQYKYTLHKQLLITTFVILYQFSSLHGIVFGEHVERSDPESAEKHSKPPNCYPPPSPTIPLPLPPPPSHSPTHHAGVAVICSLLCAVCSVQCAMCGMQCAMCSLQYAVCSV